jgi:ubiquinone/menaquinone biosynthesis C-methylase UbiE
VRSPHYVPALGFHWLTPAYDAVVGVTTRERTFKSALIEQANFQSGQQVLDVACGTGTLAVWIQQRHPGVTVTAIDGDPKILAIAAHKASAAQVSIQFDHGFSFSLPYPDARFDRVVSTLFFHHLSWSDKQRTAAELHRVLRPGGELHVADWGRATGFLMRGAFQAIQLLDGRSNTQDNVEGKLAGLFEDAGFTNVLQTRTFSTVFGTMALYRAARPAAAASEP